MVKLLHYDYTILPFIIGRVGKTSILSKYIHNKFNDKEDMTVNSCYFEKELTYNGENFTFCIWDTAGQEKFNALTPIYYRDAKGAILVYDITLSDTFKRVKKWVEELKAFNKDTVIAIAGNKVDLKKFDIDKDEIDEYCLNENAKHFYTSAKTGEGLDEIFTHITKVIAENHQEAERNKANVMPGTSKGNKKIVLTKESSGKKENKGCCK